MLKTLHSQHYFKPISVTYCSPIREMLCMKVDDGIQHYEDDDDYYDEV
jgi:hypothetical protein